MAKDKGGVTIEPKPVQEGIVYMNVMTKILKLTVTNQIDTCLIFQCAVLGWFGPFKVEDSLNIIRESKKANLMGYRQISFTVTLTGSPNPGVYSLPVAFMFRRGDNKPFHIVKYIRAIIVDDIVTRLRPTRPYKRRELFYSSGNIEHGQPPFA